MPWDARRSQWRDALRSQAFPRINDFKPDLIFISAGFDAHEKEELARDFGKFIEFDYSWITEELHKLANKHCKGRLISVLEGGYNIHGGIMSPLAQSVAFHVDCLRSRSKEVYKEQSTNELELLAELDSKKEDERQQTTDLRKREENQRNKRTKRETEKLDEVEMVDIEVEEDFFHTFNNIVDTSKNENNANLHNVNEGNGTSLQNLANSEAVIGKDTKGKGDKEEINPEVNTELIKVKLT